MLQFIFGTFSHGGVLNEPHCDPLIHRDIVAKKQLAPIWAACLVAKRAFVKHAREQDVTFPGAVKANALFTLPCQSEASDNFTIHYPLFNHHRRATSKCGKSLALITRDPSTTSSSCRRTECTFPGNSSKAAFN